MSRPGDPIAAERPPPFVSVVVPVLDDSVRLAACLDALERQTYPSDRFEVVVVDNGSSDDVAGVTRGRARVVLVAEARRGSYAARNAGIAASKGSVLAFTDSDCVAADDWLDRGVDRLVAHPSCGVVGGRIDVVPRDPAHVRAVEIYDSIAYLRQEHYVSRLRYAATANLFTRRAIVDEVGQFDPELPSAGDLEWTRRVGAAGYEVLYADDCRVTHPARRSLAELRAKSARIGRGMGAMRRRRPASLGQGTVAARCLYSLSLALPPVRAAWRNREQAHSSGAGKAGRVVLLTVFDHYVRLWARAGAWASARRPTAGGRAAG